MHDYNGQNDIFVCLTVAMAMVATEDTNQDQTPVTSTLAMATEIMAMATTAMAMAVTATVHSMATAITRNQPNEVNAKNIPEQCGIQI
jgi:hypothetical protein